MIEILFNNWYFKCIFLLILFNSFYQETNLFSILSQSSSTVEENVIYFPVSLDFFGFSLFFMLFNELLSNEFEKTAELGRIVLLFDLVFVVADYGRFLFGVDNLIVSPI